MPTVRAIDTKFTAAEIETVAIALYSDWARYLAAQDNTNVMVWGNRTPEERTKWRSEALRTLIETQWAITDSTIRFST